MKNTDQQQLRNRKAVCLTTTHICTVTVALENAKGVASKITKLKKMKQKKHVKVTVKPVAKRPY